MTDYSPTPYGGFKLINSSSFAIRNLTSEEQDNTEEVFTSNDQHNTIFVKLWKLAIGESNQKMAKSTSEEIPTIMVPKKQFLKLYKCIYLAFYKIKPELIPKFLEETS